MLRDRNWDNCSGQILRQSPESICMLFYSSIGYIFCSTVRMSMSNIHSINFVQLLRLNDIPCGLVRFEYWPCWWFQHHSHIKGMNFVQILRFHDNTLRLHERKSMSSHKLCTDLASAWLFKPSPEDHSDLTILSLLTALQWQLLYHLRITDNSWLRYRV